MKRLIALPIALLLALPPRAQADPVSMVIGVTLALGTLNLYIRSLKCYLETGESDIEICERKKYENKIQDLPKLESGEDLRVIRDHFKEHAPTYREIYAKEWQHMEPWEIPVLAPYKIVATHLKNINLAYIEAIKKVGGIRPPSDLVGLSLLWRSEDQKFANWLKTAEKIEAMTVDAIARDLLLTDISIWNEN